MSLKEGFKKLMENRVNVLTGEEITALKEIGFNIPNNVKPVGMPDYDLDILIELVDDRSKMPEYYHEDDAGLDVFACLFDVDEKGKPDFSKPIDEVVIYPGETKLICVGFKYGITGDWYLSVNPRSGISGKTQLRVANAPGTCDAGFKDPVHVLVWNASQQVRFNENGDIVNTEVFTYDCKEKQNRHGSYIIRTGDKIAQMIPQRRYKANVFSGDIHSVGTDRLGGYGHSGITSKS